MKSILPKVIILGATGMLGRTLYLYLSERYTNVYGTSRMPKSKFIYLNALNPIEKLEKIFEKMKPKYIINCIGALRNRNKETLKFINSDFPKNISRLSKKNNFKIINISTDAVFGDDQKEVNEDSAPLPSAEYGKSKMAGEQKLNTLSIRTSILGFDPNEHKGLLESLMKKRNNISVGFTNQKWSGATTLQLAEFIENLIYNRELEKFFKKTNVLHFAPLKSNKYKIIKTFANLFGFNKPKIGSGKEITRILESKYISKIELKRYDNSLNNSLRKLIKFDQNYVKKYKKK